MLLGLIFLSQRLWVLGGILTGIGAFLLFAIELYAVMRSRPPARKTLPPATRQSLAMYNHIAMRRAEEGEEENKSTSNEQASLTSRERLSQARSRGSLASVLEMMSITLATMPSSSRNRLPVPLGKSLFNTLRRLSMI